jgi:hypothetical protein
MVYAGPWICNDESHKFRLGDPGCETSKDLLNKLFISIFESKYTDYTFYIHNLAKFDSIFILDALTSFDYNIKSVVKEDNSIVSLKISKPVTKLSKTGIKIRKLEIKKLGSNLMVKGSLRDLCKIFDCLVQKGHFPYSVVNSETLNYIGEVPSINYYESLDLKDYKKLCSQYLENNWSVKKETLKYLELDLRSLLELLLKFS